MVELSAGGVDDFQEEEDTEEKVDGVDEPERVTAVGGDNMVLGGDVAHSLRREEQRSGRGKGGLGVGKIQPCNGNQADLGKESFGESRRVGEDRERKSMIRYMKSRQERRKETHIYISGVPPGMVSMGVRQFNYDSYIGAHMYQHDWLWGRQRL